MWVLWNCNNFDHTYRLGDVELGVDLTWRNHQVKFEKIDMASEVDLVVFTCSGKSTDAAR